MDSDYFSLTQQNSPVERAGYVVRVQVKNFMCHDNLEVKLNPRINFVIGKNGSGKSAIQTAIAIGLGGKALSTNRGSSLKALIKSDKNTANILIVIANEGPMAYKPEVFGHIIQVERYFSQTSSQGYRIKSASGNLVSNEKKELDKIIAHMNIQVDNPVCILHQDVARNFLNTSDPKNLFKFFMKASRFDDITSLYAESSSKALTIRGNIDRKFEVVRQVFNDVLQMKKKLKLLEEAKQKEKIKEKLENELIWAKVHEVRLELEEQQKRKEAEEQSKKNLELKLKEIEESNLKEKLRELELELVEKDNQVKDAREKLRPARDKYAKMREHYANIMTELTESKQSVKRAKVKYDHVVSEVERVAKDAPEIKIRQEKLRKEISDCEAELEAIQAAERSVDLDRQHLLDTIEKISSNLETVSNQYNDIQRQINKRQDQIRQLAKSANNLTVYGELMVKFVDEVNKAFAQRKFKKKPIGPLGMHIKVREPSWAGAVESFLGKGLLYSFCVDNVKDKEILASIRHSVYYRQSEPQPAIIQSKFITEVHNTGPNETGTRKYKSLHRMLDIDNPVVTNCLIDQQEVETVLLIHTNNEAYQILDKQHKVPKNCKRAFTQSGDQFYPAPNYKSYSSMRPVTHATLLHVAQEDIVRELKNEVVKLTNEKNVLEEERKKIQLQEKDTSLSIKKNDEERRKLRRQVFTSEQKLRNLKDALESENVSNVAYFVEEAKELKIQLEKESEKYNNLKDKIDQLKEETEEAKNVYERLQHTIAESDKEKAPIQGEIQRLKSTIQQASSKGDLMRQRLKEHEKKIAVFEKEISESNRINDENTENASQICEPVETDRSTDVINRELKSIVLYLKKIEEENGGSLEVLEKNFNERQITFNAVMKDLEIVRRLTLKMQMALKNRKLKESALKTFLSNSAKHNFMMFLSERNFDGKLEFDMDAGLLTIKVKPLHDKSNLNAQRLDTASLSGGEKSFATVCFVMALWQEVELPFHFLDEFDVFMDGVNRRIVMDLLLSYANNINQQFVFLTPLDTSSIKASDTITVHRLEPPRQ